MALSLRYLASLIALCADWTVGLFCKAMPMLSFKLRGAIPRSAASEEDPYSAPVAE
jgi:hypothetical protein